MAKATFNGLSTNRRREALAVAEEHTGRPAHLLEKDLWVVQTLRILFDAPFGGDLVLKGGTSLSKAYHAIRRFSEDIDVTYDIRALAPDLVCRPGVDNAGYDPLPPSRSQVDHWSKAINAQLSAWIAEKAVPAIEEGMEPMGWTARVHVDGHRLYIAYKSSFEGHSFVKPHVMVDFGARSTGRPHQECEIVCDAAVGLPGFVFTTVRPAVMLPERTFWEKATAMHVFCLQERVRGERFSRHWFDLVRLAQAGYGGQALEDRSIATAVARHKSMFFREQDSHGKAVDYFDAISGNLRLIPTGDARSALAKDYERMRSSGMLLDESESFDQLLEECADLERRANNFVPR